MSHTINWLVEKRVVMLSYDGNVDKVELHAVNADLAAFLEAGEAPVHIIADTSRMTSIPWDLKTLQNSIGVLRDKKWGMAFLVGADTMLRYLGQFVSSSFHLNMHLVKSIDDAKTYIMQHDETLSSNW